MDYEEPEYVPKYGPKYVPKYVPPTSDNFMSKVDVWFKGEKFLYFLCAVLALLVFVVSKSAFASGEATCSNYLTNVYLYLTTALVLLAIVMHSMYLRGMKVESWMLWGGLIASIALIVVVYKFGTDPSNQMRNHLLVTALVVVTGVMLYPSYKALKQGDGNVMRNALLITGSLFVLLIFLSYNNPQYFNPENYKYLIYALVGLILVEIAVFWFMNPSRQVRTLIIFLGALLFAIFIAYDTRILLERRNRCQVPNYPIAMIDIFYDVINLFLRVASLTNN